MTAGMLVEPDLEFVAEVIASGGGDVKKCFQCGTCSVTCSLSPAHATFPRRQMLQAQWGLKQSVLADPSIWLCHNCGDCSDRCPRGARPGDVFGALRSLAIAHYAFPRMLGAMVASPGALLLLVLLPAVIFGVIAAVAGSSAVVGPPEFAMVFPQSTLEALFFSVAGIALVAFAVGLIRFTRALRAAGYHGHLATGLLPAASAIATHARFASCASGSTRRWGHFLTLWGFVGLACMGTIVGVGSLAGLMHTPLPLFSPLKVFANVAAIVALVGTAILLAERVADPVARGRSTYFDWLFVLTLFGVLVTGLVSEILRISEAGAAMYGVYFVHLVLIFCLFLYAPYSKFAHLAYRAVAMAVVGVDGSARAARDGGRQAAGRRTESPQQAA